MHMVVAFFSPRKTSNRRRDGALELKVQVRTAINADDDTVVSERDCGDPGYGGVQTIVLVMHPRRPAVRKKLLVIGASNAEDLNQLLPVVAIIGGTFPPNFQP